MAMTVVPSSLLRDTAVIRDHLGAGGDGPVFAEPRTVPVKFEGKRRAVRTAAGTDVISTATLVVRPGHEAPTESQVDCRGTTYDVAEVIPMEGLTRPAGYQMVLL